MMMIHLILTLLMALMSGNSWAEDDWQVTTPAWKKRAEKYEVLYRGIKTQEAWDKAFTKAFEQGDVNVVQYLIKITKKRGLDFDPNAKDSNGKTLLHKAVVRDKLPLLKALVRFGADINAEDDSGNRPLHLAIQSLALKSTKYLLSRKNIKRDVENKNGERPLGLAIGGGNLKLIQILRGHKFDLDFKVRGVPLDEWVFTRDSIAGFELVYGQINPKEPPVTKLGAPVLHAAARFNATKLTKYFLQKRIDPWLKDDQKRTAFEVALMTHDSLEIAELYLNKDKNFVQMADEKQGNTPLHIAIAQSDFAMVDLLLKYKAPTESYNHFRQTPADILARRKADLKATDPTLIATFEKYEKLIKTAPVFDKKLAKVIEKNDAKEFKKLLPALKESDYAPLIQKLNSTHSIELLAVLMNDRRFGNCGNNGCPIMSLFHYADAKLVDLLLEKKPRPNLNNRTYRAIADRVANLIASNKHAFGYLEDIARILKKRGILTEDERLKLIEELNTLLASKKGSKIFSKHLVQTLLEQEDDSGEPHFALSYAMLYDDLKFTEKLLKNMPKTKGITIRNQALASAAMKKILKKYGIAVEKKSKCIEPIETFYESPLALNRLASWIEKTQLKHCSDAKEVLIVAIDLAKEDQIVLTALYKIPAVKAGINEGDPSPLNTAVSLCNIDAVNFLLQQGADATLKDVNKTSPLGNLVRRQCPSDLIAIIDALVKAGADPNEKSIQGGEPLIVTALNWGDDKLFGALLKHGADFTVQYPNSLLTVAEYAASYGDDARRDILIEAGIKPYQERSCTQWPPDGKSYGRIGLVFEPPYSGETNTILLAYRQNQKELQSKESCDAVKQRAETEFNKELLLLGEQLGQWKNAGTTWKKSAQTQTVQKTIEQQTKLPFDYIDESSQDFWGQQLMCCAFNDEFDRCRSQLICDGQKENRETANLFCDRFGDESQQALQELKIIVQELKVDSDWSEWRSTQARLDRGREILADLNLDATDLLSIEVTDDDGVIDNNDSLPQLTLMIPLSFTVKDGAYAGLTQDQIQQMAIDAQMPAIYKKMHLGSLKDYVEWKYPQCAGQISESAELSGKSTDAKNVSPTEVDKKDQESNTNATDPR